MLKQETFPFTRNIWTYPRTLFDVRGFNKRSEFINNNKNKSVRD